MNLLKLLRSRSKWFYVLLIMLGVMSSLTSMGILLLINMTLGGEAFSFPKEYLPIAFLGLLAFSFCCSSFFQTYITTITNGMLVDLELSIVEKVRKANFESFEKYGIERIYAAISDARVLSRVPEMFVSLINSIITIACALFFLFWTSPAGGAAILVIMANLLLIYLARNQQLEKGLNEVRDLQNFYYRSLQELLFGFKQIRVSSLRSKNLYHRHILTNRKRSKDVSIRISKGYVVNQLIGTYSWYILFAIILFLLTPVLKFTVEEIATFITSVLFMMAPISQLITFFPFVTTCKVALQRINDIYSELEVHAINPEKPVQFPKVFETIRFEHVTYRYENGGRSSFALADVTLQINKGEILFIVGGNGSGKSTFINLLSGLCTPSEGKVLVNGKEVPWDEYSLYSNNMAIVFSNQHLFSENYDSHDLSESNAVLSGYRDMLMLEGIMQVDPLKNRIGTNLSKGEQKRMALLLCLMENKPIIVLDEWAAEQDPKHRKYFYTQWLNQMIAMGKTVIAVTHDDDFYHVAHRVVKFNVGRVAEEPSYGAQPIENR